MAVTISKLALIITANTAGLRKGLGKAGKMVKGLGRAVMAMGAAMGAVVAAGIAVFVAGLVLVARALFKVTKRSFEMLDSLGKSSDLLGISTQKLAAYGRMAERAGVSQEGLRKAIQKMVKNVSDSVGGFSEASDAIEALGLNAEKLNMLRPDEMLKVIAEAMSKLTNNNDKLRISADLFGQRGAAMVRLLNQGEAGFEAAEKAATKYNIAISASQINKIERANDAIADLKTAWQGLGDTLAVQFAPTIEKVFNAVADKLATFVQLLERFMTIWGIIKGESLLEGIFNAAINAQETVVEQGESVFKDDPDGTLDDILKQVSGLADNSSRHNSALRNILTKVASIDNTTSTQVAVMSAISGDAQRMRSDQGFGAAGVIEQWNQP